MLSRSTKASHSWSTKGKEWTLMNIWYSNSTSLITAITSNGDVFAADTNRFVTGKMLIKFIDELEIFLRQNSKISISKWLIILDNVSTHWCALMKKYIEENNLNFEFIPPYSPEMAPVERYFSLPMRVVGKKTTGLQINWKSDKSKTMLQESMLQISPMSVRNIWLTFTFELKKSINNLNDII